MTEHTNESISPAVKRVLDEYIDALHGDEEINREAADRLDALLRKGSVPKVEDIDAALLQPPAGRKT